MGIHDMEDRLMDVVKIKFEFERGGVLYGMLNPNKAPETVSRIAEVLPIEGDAIQSRWCGREISCGFSTKELPPRENASGAMSKFDITYWRPWDRAEKMPESPAFECVAFYYGAERPSYHDGLLSLNVIGHISYDQEELLEQIGERVWLQGSEKMKISLCES